MVTSVRGTLQSSCHFHWNDDISQYLIQLMLNWDYSGKHKSFPFLNTSYWTIFRNFICDMFLLCSPSETGFECRSFHLSLKHCDHRCPCPGFPYESHRAVCFPTIYRIKEAKAEKEITDKRKQCYANQAITKAHQEAWGQLQKNGKNTPVYSRSQVYSRLWHYLL